MFFLDIFKDYLWIHFQVSTIFEDDLQSVVQMGFGQIQQQGFHGMQNIHEKI